MKLKTRLSKFFAAACVAVFAALPAAAANDLRYGGSSTIGTGILKAGAAKEFTIQTGIRFTSVEQPGSGQGIQALLAGRVPLAGISRPLKSEEEKQKLIGTTIGFDAIAIYVHQSNPVRNLTKTQLKGIFTGQIKNWKEVGGNDAPIAPNSEYLAGKRATVEMFQELVLNYAAYGKGVKELDMPRDQLVDLAANSNAIGAVSFGLRTAVPYEIRQEIKTIAVDGIEPSEKDVRSGAYPISRPLLLVTTSSPIAEAQEFVRFMRSADGQKIVDKNFIPLAPAGN